MEPNSNSDDRKKEEPPQGQKNTRQSRPLFLIGVALLAVAIILGVTAVALHYGTGCSPSNMFACHSLYNPSGGNNLPILTGVTIIIFVIGLVMAYVYGQKK